MADWKTILVNENYFHIFHPKIKFKNSPTSAFDTRHIYRYAQNFVKNKLINLTNFD